jgi:hypothetical protein
MATTLDRLLDAGSISTSVYGITKSARDAAAAAGYGAWVESVTGAYPKVVETAVPDSSRTQALLTLTPDQQVAMRRWIESQASSGRDSDAALQIDFSRVINPLVVKYAVILIGIGFVAGFMTRGITR